MQFAHFGKSGRKEEAFALSASSSSQARNEQFDKKIIFFFVCIYIIKLRLSKRPFRDSNCRYAFRLATTQTGGGYLFACKAGCSPFGFGKGSPI